MITAKRLDEMIGEYERRLEAMRLTRALMNGAGRAVKAKTIDAVVEEAIALRGKRGPYKKKHGGPAAKRSSGYSSAMLAGRERTARALDHVKEHGPMTSEEITKATGVKIQWTGPMRSRGYLRRTADGKYTRTAKAFLVNKGKAEASASS